MSDPRPPYESYDPRLRPQGPGQSDASHGWDGPGWGPQAPQPQPGQTPLGWNPATADISQYAAPRMRTSTIVVIVAALALVGVLFAAVFLHRPDSPTPTPTSPSATSSASGAGMPFTMPSDPDSTGRWEILGRDWSAAGVSVHVRITASSGSISYAFQAYGKGSQDATAPTQGGRQPELSTGILSAGEVADGYVFLELDRGDSTLFLTTRGGRAISALPIAA